MFEPIVIKPVERKSLVYICGPMRNLPDSNWPAFDHTAIALRDAGFDVINPADLDRAAGISSMNFVADLSEVARRDVDAVFKVDILCLLPGWNHWGYGARAEVGLGLWLGKEFMYSETFLMMSTVEVVNALYAYPMYMRDTDITGRTPLLCPGRGSCEL